jgi:hypothetical protein
MSMAAVDWRPLSLPVSRAIRPEIKRLPRLLAAAGMLLIAAHQFYLGLQSPAQQIKRALTAAAEETGQLPWSRSQMQVRSDLARYFASHAVTIDSTKFPAAVSVAFVGLDRNTCAEANELARRIDGSVVVRLEGYGSAADCGDSNTMVWRIMP